LTVLVADLGNTRIKWAVLDGGRLTGQSAAPWGGRGGLARALDGCWGSLTPCRRAVVASVGGVSVREALGAWLRGRWQIEVEFVTPAREGFGVTCAYQAPETLGADRWAALVAARRRYERGVLIADCGTAITIDALAAGGRHLGGAIAPGLFAMCRSLVESTAEVRDTGGAATLALGRTTGDAVAAGTLYAAVGLIERVAADLAPVLGAEAQLVVTGGDGRLVGEGLARPCEHIADLVLEGLAIIAGP